MVENEPESNYAKHQKLVSEQQNYETPSKFYNHFLYKIALVVVFFVILSLFPSQAPEFFNQSVVTRSWELLYLLLVGIAVSYGLFSRRNEKTDMDNNHTKFDNAHSYVSRFPQVSVFGDETETSPGSGDNKVQTWSSQYYRNEPVVVGAQEHSALNEQKGTASRIGEETLLLPVRSLKQHVPENWDTIESVKESSGDSGSLSRSNWRSGSKRFSSKSNKAKGGDFGGLDHQELEEKLNESVVLPSPIPWRSRSGRLDVKEEVDNNTPPMEESVFSRQESWGSRSQGSRSSRLNSISSSPKVSPSPSLSSPKKSSPSPALSSSESQTKNAEDLGRKKSLYKSSPPPPPLPPTMFYKSSSTRLIKDGVSYEKDLRRSFSSGTNNMNKSNGEFVTGRVNSGIETKQRSYVDGLSMSKSIRTTRAGESAAGAWKVMEKSSKEVETSLVEKVVRKKEGFDETSFRAEKMRPESFHNMSKFASFNEFSEAEKEQFLDKVGIESDEETENEDDGFDENLIWKDIREIPKTTPNNYVSVSGNVGDAGQDVDKKADEFIAKFREQIRLQRIDLIKRSSAQISKNLSR
ncbi:hypothetical protein ACFX2I_037683 [Malus domestica]